MEVAGSTGDQVIYMSHVPKDQDRNVEYGRLIERVRSWTGSHGIILGEGVIRYDDCGAEALYGLFNLEAPMISGPIVRPDYLDA
jgi:hypothetical protein